MSVMDGIYERLQSTKANKSLLKKYFIPKIIDQVSEKSTPTYGSNFGQCIFTAMALDSCVIGLNAPDPEIYTEMAPLYDAVIKDYHKLNPKEEIRHPEPYFGNDLDYADLDPDGQFIVSTKVQINRSLQGHVFANAVTPETRDELENKSKEALSSLTGELAGSYHPIDSLSPEQRDELANDNLLFDCSEKWLEINGVYKDWPFSRGIFINGSKSFVAWVNGEDHLKLISTQTGNNIGAAYKQIVNAVKMLERNLKFVRDDRLGYLTYCPSNVGTGLHAIFHVKIPHLAAKNNFKATCDKLKLTAESLQKIPMEGFDAVYAVSNKRTIGLTEIEIMQETIANVGRLIQLERDAAEGKDTTRCIVA